MAWGRGNRLTVTLAKSASPVQGGNCNWAKGAQHQDPGHGAWLDQEAEQLQRRRIHPAQVLHDKEHRLLGRRCAAKIVRRTCRVCRFCMLRRHGQRGIDARATAGRGRPQRSGTVSAIGRPYCTRNPSSLRSFRYGNSSRSKRSATRSSRFDRRRARPCSGTRANTGMASATPAARWPRARQNTCTSAICHCPPRRCEAPPARHPFLHLRPALPHQPRLPAPGPPAGSTRAPSRLQATAGRAPREHPIDRQRLGEAFQQRRA